MNDNYIVTKANTLITSNYDLSLEEQRIILTLASMVQPNDEEFKAYKFKISDFLKLLGIEDKRKYSRIPKITKELMQKVLEIEKEDDIIQVAWISSAHYRKGTGTVELEFSPKLKPYMLGLKEFYTSYRLKNVLELKGKYSIRIYEILKSNEFKKIAIIEVDELRKILKVNSGSYLVYQNFKNRIILKAQKELKEKTDISFDFEEVKTGRKVTSIKFYIHKNNKKSSAKTIANKAKREIAATKEIEEDTEQIKKVKSLIKENITSLEATKLLSAANNNIELIKEKYDISKSMNNIDNLVGWLIRAVKENYQAPVNKRKKDPFIDREQASYDLDKIEKVLLGLEHYEDEKDSDTKKEIQIIQDMIKEDITEDNAIALLVESNHNIELIKQKYEISKLINNIDDRAKWIIEQLKAERLKNTKT
ncbi:replication initiation protein [Clostridium sp. DL1XJH146]